MATQLDISHRLLKHLNIPEKMISIWWAKNPKKLKEKPVIHVAINPSFRNWKSLKIPSEWYGYQVRNVSLEVKNDWANPVAGESLNYARQHMVLK